MQKDPPNFLIEADLRMYVTQEVYVPQEEEEPPAEGNLIDTSDGSTDHLDRSNSISPAPSQIHLEMFAAEKQHLLEEIHRLQ